ncbi:MAG: hypothetical protein E6G96_04155, partial [Alphaproteobacteria bacterium]
MRRTLISAAAILLFTGAADARVTRIEIGRSEPFAANQQFGDTGAYEKIVGRFYGELDPSHPLNAGIVDLANAPRNANGRVGYSADFYILKPVDLSKGNGALLYDVNNRGNKRALIQFNNAPAATRRSPLSPSAGTKVRSPRCSASTNAAMFSNMGTACGRSGSYGGAGGICSDRSAATL